jgi:hypothetical protein
VLEIHSAARQEALVFPLESTARRRLLIVNVPESFGDTPEAGLFLVRGTKRGTSAPGGVRLFGLGAGPRAVGSVAIDQVDFRPGAMRVSQKQRASYSFYSRSDFNRTVVEILRVQRSGDEVKVSLARSTPLDVTVSRGTWIGRSQPLTWDGLDGENHVSSGPHLLQIRAWLNSQDLRDWVAAWSPNTVTVSE